MSTTHWFLRRTGAATILVIGLSCNSTPETKPPVTGCTIAGTDYADNAVNPDDPCQSCQLGVSATSWTNLADGLKCNQGNSVCTGGACRPGCFISGMFYAAPDLDPTNSCKICHPGETTTAWTDLPAGSSCADGGICTGGTCKVGCYIGGVVYSNRSENPADPSLCCNQQGDPSGWSSRLRAIATPPDLGAQGVDLVAADFDGDGNDDLAAIDSTHDWVTLLLSDGTGGFKAPLTLPTDPKPRTLVVADLDGDGKPDLIVQTVGLKLLDVLINKGAGAFAPKVSNPGGTGVVGSMTAGDFDMDGKQDLMCSEFEDGIAFYKGLGSGTLTPSVSVFDAGAGGLASGDIGNGALDLVAGDLDAGQLTLLIGMGDGTFPTPQTIAQPDTHDLLMGDLNADGLVDIALTSSVDLQVFLQMSPSFVQGVFTPPSPPGGMAMGDLSGSGRKSLLFSAGGVAVLAPPPDPDAGALAIAPIATQATASGRIAVGDFNGDHATDVAVLSGTTISVFLNGCP